MLRYVLQRIFVAIPTLIAVSMISFILIQLPPGDYLTTYIATLESMGQIVREEELNNLKQRYALDRPIYEQYWKWITDILLHGDFGVSFAYDKAVRELVMERMALTVVISTVTMLFNWAVAFPIGIYSATHQYSILDYIFSGVSFIGLGTPGFMLALVVMWISYRYFDISVGGLFSRDMENAPWSMAKVVDLMLHLWIPVVILAVGGTAGLIRTMRANLLDELRKPYVTTARAKGLKERRLLFKYPVRVALNPFVSTVGWMLPRLVSGSTILSVVLSLPTTGPLLLQALQAQDMFLAGSFLLMLSSLTVVGTLLSDLLLAVIDPRIRLGGV
jgi:peptide/nickel transport system permease protein